MNLGERPTREIVRSLGKARGTAERRRPRTARIPDSCSLALSLSLFGFPSSHKVLKDHAIAYHAVSDSLHPQKGKYARALVLSSGHDR